MKRGSFFLLGLFGTLDRELKGAPLVLFALGADAFSGCSDHRFDNIEAKADADLVKAAALVALVETLENVGQVGRRNALTFVEYRHL